MAKGIPPEDIKAVMRGPHFECAKGEAAESEYLFEGVPMDEDEITPIGEIGHFLDHSSRYVLVSDGDTSEEAYNLLSEGILNKIPIPLLFDKCLIPPTYFLVIEEDDSLIVAEVDNDPDPLPLSYTFLLLYNLLSGGVLDHHGVTKLDTNLFSTGAYPTNDHVLSGFIKKKQAKDNTDFLR